MTGTWINFEITLQGQSTYLDLHEHVFGCTKNCGVHMCTFVNMPVIVGPWLCNINKPLIIFCLSIICIFLILKTLKSKYIYKHITDTRSCSARGILDIVPILAIHNRHEELFSQTVSQNSFSSTREFAPAHDPKSELFLEEPEPDQTGPYFRPTEND